jgi:hypothetical protein
MMALFQRCTLIHTIYSKIEPRAQGRGCLPGDMVSRETWGKFLKLWKDIVA